ncbi:DUF1361 domain-containing protein [Hathewaya massiliensis]|uniref:DUF1361 domain-containing protein n=1 Tax=Hathewaya massiliensis TaxID=1964382 RepID=UPI00115A83DE|nr:DUF1361 domain-containing protein [Hathewaya massiliensis]
MKHKKSISKGIEIIPYRNFLIIASILYTIFLLSYGDKSRTFMIWNIFLAWIPFGVSTCIYKISIKEEKKNYVFPILVLGVVWLFFYPNTNYLFTDLMHFSSHKFYIPNPKYSPYNGEPKILFNDNFNIWIDFFIMVLGAWLGYILGFLSLYLNMEIIKIKLSKFASWIFVIIVNILSGFAIYLGRFIRFNSWDIFNPKIVLKILNENINEKSMKFTLLFGSLSMILYIILYFLTNIKSKN